MKKRILLGITTLLMIGIGTSVYATNAVKLVINGNEVSTDVSPQIIDGRTMVPIRIISESLGAEVQFDGETKTVTITKDNKAIENSNEKVDEVELKDLETLKEEVITNVLSENPRFERDDLQSFVAEVQSIITSTDSKEQSLRVTTIDKQNKHDADLLPNGQGDKLLTLEEGQKIIVVTTRLWMDSHPAQNIALDFVVLD